VTFFEKTARHLTAHRAQTDIPNVCHIPLAPLLSQEGWREAPGWFITEPPATGDCVARWLPS